MSSKEPVESTPACLLSQYLLQFVGCYVEGGVGVDGWLRKCDFAAAFILSDNTGGGHCLGVTGVKYRNIRLIYEIW